MAKSSPVPDTKITEQADSYDIEYPTHDLTISVQKLRAKSKSQAKVIADKIYNTRYKGKKTK